ncbi:hypothetical protein GCM10009846_27120 [Agrococcus versicolor]|uniref:Uncharacterized protein n=1 Tax=Agrococcus versicolor TaxID=501482 RepID=A0ABP5MS08_9MICO
MQQRALAVAIAAIAVILSGCAPSQTVDLATVFDTEANDVLTSQRDATDELCDGSSNPCIQALTSDQASIFSYASTEDALHHAERDDSVIADVFLVRWQDDAPAAGRVYVESLLGDAHSSD